MPEYHTKHYMTLAAALRRTRETVAKWSQPDLRLDVVDQLEHEILKVLEDDNPFFSEKLFKEAARPHE